jgi:hypothetical protein
MTNEQVLCIILIIAIILLVFKENFVTLTMEPAPWPTSELPKTSGASLRKAVVDSASNRGVRGSGFIDDTYKLI